MIFHAEWPLLTALCTRINLRSAFPFAAAYPREMAMPPLEVAKFSYRNHAGDANDRCPFGLSWSRYTICAASRP